MGLLKLVFDRTTFSGLVSIVGRIGRQGSFPGSLRENNNILRIFIPHFGKSIQMYIDTSVHVSYGIYTVVYSLRQKLIQPLSCQSRVQHSHINLCKPRKTRKRKSKPKRIPFCSTHISYEPLQGCNSGAYRRGRGRGGTAKEGRLPLHNLTFSTK